MPPELQKGDKTRRDRGRGSLADEGLRLMNHAAEDAVKHATHIFVSGLQNMTFTAAKNILLGADNSATVHLQKTTATQLYGKFKPIIKSSFSKVGADKVSSNIIKQ